MGIFAPRFSGDRISGKLKMLIHACTWDAIALYFTLPIAEAWMLTIWQVPDGV
ncbi:hypothetical protein [Nostoc sp. 'Peltigera membranacea cyanobiont' N6]|uniref:hypothetical protein n=1 Tax=Nostoc sp. 'Peltigera membranacea cyanobiont' N6 TaxID=1261031 RepID=UPI0015E2AD0E|nr:hypothetical protein [Nostoc sp. 'Peltigera membranacea cyanobiont' N6]